MAGKQHTHTHTHTHLATWCLSLQSFISGDHQSLVSGLVCHNSEQEEEREEKKRKNGEEQEEEKKEEEKGRRKGVGGKGETVA